MRAKTILTVLFLISLAVAVVVIFRALPDLTGAGAQEAARDEILVATAALPAGTLLRPQDVVWERAKGETQPGEVVRPEAAAREAGDLDPGPPDGPQRAEYAFSRSFPRGSRRCHPDPEIPERPAIDAALGRRSGRRGFARAGHRAAGFQGKHQRRHDDPDDARGDTGAGGKDHGRPRARQARSDPAGL